MEVSKTSQAEQVLLSSVGQSFIPDLCPTSFPSFPLCSPSTWSLLLQTIFNPEGDLSAEVHRHNFALFHITPVNCLILLLSCLARNSMDRLRRVWSNLSMTSDRCALGVLQSCERSAWRYQGEQLPGAQHCGRLPKWVSCGLGNKPYRPHQD